MMRRLAAISCLAALAALLASPAAAQLMNGTTGWSYITTLSANNTAATLQFTGPNFPNSYNTLFINCTGLLVGTANNPINAEIGEGSGPTWQGIGSNTNNNACYTSTQDAKPALPCGTGGAGADDLFDGNANLSTTVPTSIRFFIHSPGSSTAYKMVYYWESGVLNGGLSNDAGQAWWANDTNPLTGFELDTGVSAKIKAGTCSIYGLN